MRRERGRLRGAAALLLVAAAGLTAAACPERAPVTSPAAPPVILLEPAPPPAPPPPAPGERELSDADLAWRRGDWSTAARILDTVVEMGSASPARPEALFRLAVLLARPDAADRDAARAQFLLVQVLASDPAPARETEARLLLALLGREAETERSIADLRAQLELEKAERETLRTALARREGELRKIKEILLDKPPSP